MMVSFLEYRENLILKKKNAVGISEVYPSGEIGYGIFN
jgi:hypothetical protein